MKDEDILTLLKKENYTKASEKLYAYFPVVRKQILANSGSRQDAEDIYQEALIVFFRKVQNPEFILTSSINTYLYSICRYLWSDVLKKRKIKTKVHTDTNEIAGNDTIWEEQEEKIKLAEQAVNRLGQRCKQLLQLFYYGKVDLKTIAQKMGFANEKVAKNQKYRCLENARTYLQTLKNNSHE